MGQPMTCRVIPFSFLLALGILAPCGGPYTHSNAATPIDSLTPYQPVLSMTAVRVETLQVSQPEPGNIDRAVARAHRLGQTKASISTISEDDGSFLPALDVLRTVSVVVADAVNTSAAQVVRRDGIATWHVFRRIETLRSTPADRGCKLELPPSIRALSEDEFALQVYGGVTTAA